MFSATLALALAVAVAVAVAQVWERAQKSTITQVSGQGASFGV
jgi:hypothetical protein